MLHWPMNQDDLASNLRDTISQNATRIVIPSNKTIYMQEDRASKLYIILSGYVKITYLLEDGTIILYDIIAPGCSFGELGVFDNSVYQDTATTVGEVSVLAVKSELFRPDSPKYAEMRGALSVLVAQRYRDYLGLARALYMKSLSARLAGCLVRLVGNLGKRVEYEGEPCLSLGPVVTQSDLGAMARGTRGNVNRVLKRWEREGLITLSDRSIVLHNLPRLELIAAGEGAE